MIITEPALAIIKDTFSLPSFGAGTRRFGRSRGMAAPLTSKAYADAGLLTASERGRGAAPNQGSAPARRTAPKR